MVRLSTLLTVCCIVSSVGSYRRRGRYQWAYMTSTEPTITCPIFWKRYGTSCYYYESAPMHFDKAEVKCLERDATLFVADTLEEWTEVLERSQPNTFTWIGLVRDEEDLQPKWKTPGGMPMRYVNWLVKHGSWEANGWSPATRCVAHANTANKYALFYDCGMHHASICERNATLLSELWDSGGKKFENPYII